MPLTRTWKFTRRTVDNVPNERAHPLVKVLYVHMIAEHLSRQELATRSGVERSTMSGWWTAKRRYPNLQALEACLGVFGLGLKVTTLSSPANGSLETDGAVVARKRGRPRAGVPVT